MKTTQRRPLIGGNWKMHLLRREAEAYCRAFAPPAASARAEVVLFPSFPLLPAVVEAVGDSDVAVGGQDLHPADKGAHTGDVSGAQLLDSGCRWVLCGHSERRADHREGDDLVGEKAVAAVGVGLMPMICVGESEAERDRGETFEVLERQLAAALAQRPEPFALAYEPVWAIGTGKTATPAIAQKTHRHLRELLADLLGDEAASAKRILYGGSVKPENAAELYREGDIDGFLVGGASLDPAKFLAIIRCCD